MNPKKRKYQKIDPNKHKIQYVVEVNPKQSQSKSISKTPELKQIDLSAQNQLKKPNKHYFVNGRIYVWQNNRNAFKSQFGNQKV